MAISRKQNYLTLSIRQKKKIAQDILKNTQQTKIITIDELFITTSYSQNHMDNLKYSRAKLDATTEKERDEIPYADFMTKLISKSNSNNYWAIAFTN